MIGQKRHSDQTIAMERRRRDGRLQSMAPRLALAVAAAGVLPWLVSGADSSTGAAITEVTLTPAVQSAIDAGITDNLANYSAHLIDLTTAVDSGWLLVTSFLIFFMQAGFALLEAGAVGSKDIISILLKNFTDFAISTITYWLVGEGFQRGHSPFIGASRGDDFSTDDPADMAKVLSASMFCATAVTIVSGVIACRFSFHAYMVLCVVFAGFIYPISAQWVWSQGFLSPHSSLTAIDFAGSGIVHLQGATIAITAAVLVGPRLGRFVVDPATGKTVPSTDFNGNSIVLTALGTLILFFGWFGFNPGSTGGLSGGRHQVAALAALNTAAAGSSALMTGLFLTRYMEKSYNFWDVLNSTLAGLVAITAACATVGPAVALGIGILAAFTYHFTNKQVLRWGIDDVVGAFSVHGTPGMVGLLCTGLFSRQDYIDAAFGPDVIDYNPGRQFAIQFLLLVCVVAWSFTTGGAVLWILSKTLGIRVSSDDEIVGLDFKYHSGYAYETHNKRMLRAKKQIEREQILGQKMRKQHVTGQQAAAAAATGGGLTPGATSGAPSANGSRYNTLFRDHVNGLLSSNKNSLGAPVSANDVSMQRTPVTDTLRPGGVGAMNLNAPGSAGDGTAPRSGAPSFNGMQQMDMMLAVPEFGEHDPSSSGGGEHSSMQDDISVQSGQHGGAQGGGGGFQKSAMHLRTRSLGGGGTGSGMPQSPNSNNSHLSPVQIYHYSQPQQQQQQQQLQPQQQPQQQQHQIGVHDLSAANQLASANDGSLMPGQIERSGAETSRSSKPPRNAAAAAAPASSQSLHNSPVQAAPRVISRHVSFNSMEPPPAAASPTHAAGAATTDSGPTTASNSASASLAPGVQLPVFVPRLSSLSGSGSSGVPPASSSPGPMPTFHSEASSPKSALGARRLAPAASSTATGSAGAVSAATIHAPRPQTLPVYVNLPKLAQQAPSPSPSSSPLQTEQQPDPASATAAAAAAGAGSSSPPAFQFKFVGSASAQPTPPQ